LANLAKLRSGKTQVFEQIRLSTPSLSSEVLPAKSSRWELDTTIDVRRGCEIAGLHVRHTVDMSIRPTIYFSVSDEENVVTNSRSNQTADIKNCDERGALTLFTTMETGGLVREPLRLSVFCDGSTLEIFANDRFTLSIVIYTTDPEALGFALFAEGSQESAAFKAVHT
jgi:beta-fructofuranosidase